MIATSQVPAFLKHISPMSDTVLVFKEEHHPVVVIRDVRQIGTIIMSIIDIFRTNLHILISKKSSNPINYYIFRLSQVQMYLISFVKQIPPST